MKKKPIVVSMGEPSGISSEIILKAWKSRKKYNLYPFFLVDNIYKIERMINYLKFNIETQVIQDPNEAIECFSKIVDKLKSGKYIADKISVVK